MKNNSYVFIPAEDFMVISERCCPPNMSACNYSCLVCADYIDTDCIDCRRERLNGGGSNG